MKNAEGNDSAVSARQIASTLYASWLQEAGVEVALPEGVTWKSRPCLRQPVPDSPPPGMGACNG